MTEMEKIQALLEKTADTPDAQAVGEAANALVENIK